MSMPQSFTSQRARLAAVVLHAPHDPRETSRAGREAFLASFRRQVLEAAEAKGERLSEDEVDRRAEYLKKAHFLRMAMASAKARRARKAGKP
jgi:hypothetical protein